MALSEIVGVNFVLSAFFFVRALSKALITYAQNADFPSHTKIKSRGLTEPLPKKLPTAVDIKKAIPKACFNPTVKESMYYVFQDFFLVTAAYALMKASEVFLPGWLHWPCVFLYWAVQGTLFTAIFVLGHDCGHQSFSHHGWFNDLAGNIIHSFILVPYTMWKLSHKHHHKFTNNFDKDEVFYPVKESEPCAGGKVLPGFGFGIGWFGYVLRGYAPRAVCHLNPMDPMFKGHRLACVITLLFNMVSIYLQYCHFSTFGGFTAWFKYYFIPLFIFASYMVIITFLHHNEMGITWYNDSEWDFVKGQLQTVDRHYGLVHKAIHHIGTHQMHHMFSKIPHYRLEMATSAFRKTFPDLVRICDEPILPAFMRMFAKYEKQNIIADTTKEFAYQ
ncbi:unnamed protein product [Dimorphilus gyrociliatus]|uniref:Fatty acid desaturase domain-containing protein n=1 Tax=Dimorphilus gyrociliatus TaxID=2664684 RepID=A0A7I8VMZ0_9ANNE|nr:unnamed protein product [Dimorphilus gyrociliatus]